MAGTLEVLSEYLLIREGTNALWTTDAVFHCKMRHALSYSSWKCRCPQV